MNQFDKAGIPAVLVTAIPSLAESLGVNRIVEGAAVTHPTGAPELPPAEEATYRAKLFELAVNCLGISVSGPTIFTLDGPTQ
ncbi:MAG: hypothetical protein P8M16_01230 [Acidimicrobiales bacterium]|nr:hypothetical protein [Acidimicrobiales bacterium]